MAIRMPKELNENYKKHSENYISMQKDIETMNKNQLEIQDEISEMKNILGGIESRIDRADDWINNLKDKVEITPNQSNKKKKT